jgi:hypothetical protein
MNVDGVRTEQSRGRYGVRYLLTRAFVERWLDGEVPAPQPSRVA